MNRIDGLEGKQKHAFVSPNGDNIPVSEKYDHKTNQLSSAIPYILMLDLFLAGNSFTCFHSDPRGLALLNPQGGASLCTRVRLKLFFRAREQAPLYSRH